MKGSDTGSVVAVFDAAVRVGKARWLTDTARWLTGTALGLATTLAGAQAAPVARPDKLGLCVTCHGEQGVSRLPDAPHLVGQPEIYLREQLRAFRSGKRVNEAMNVIAKGLSDDDIAGLAGWFASFEIGVKTQAGR